MRDSKLMFCVAREIVVAMINDDMSGLSQDSIDSIDVFNDCLVDLYGHALVTTEVGIDAHWGRCDCTNTLAECLILTLVEGE